MTTHMGSRIATSVHGVLTGKGADIIIIDDPLKAAEALSATVREGVNRWYGNTLCSRLNSKTDGAIIAIMQRFHENDLAGHVLSQEPWDVLSLPAIAESDETHRIITPFGERTVHRQKGDVLHPERESLESLEQRRLIIGEYNFAGQYQQSPAPLGGGIVKREWLKSYTPAELPASFEYIVQSWDTAAKATELADYSVCTTWGVHDKNAFLFDVCRRKMNYPELKCKAVELAQLHKPRAILVEDKSSGIQLIQELAAIGIYGVTPCTPTLEKAVRLHMLTGSMQTGRVRIPERALWLDDFIAELITFPRARHDDQVDSMTQALNWIQNIGCEPGFLVWMRQQGF